MSEAGGNRDVGRERLSRVDAFFARHGSKSVFLGRFVGFARALVPFLAGSSRMRYRVFLPYNALGPSCDGLPHHCPGGAAFPERVHRFS